MRYSLASEARKRMPCTTLLTDPVIDLEARSGIIRAMGADARELIWVGTSLRDLKEFPSEVQRRMGFALRSAQEGGKDPDAKVLQGFGGAGVLEVAERFDSDAYRAVYTVRLRNAVYVLHTFQKKSRHGIATSQNDVDMIRRRLHEAELMEAAETARQESRGK